MIELRSNYRYLAYMHVNAPLGGNILAFLYEEAGRYFITARLRAYVDDRVGPESQDRRRGFDLLQLSVDGDEAAVAELNRMGQTFLDTLLPLKDVIGQPTFGIFRVEGEHAVEDLVKLLAVDPMMHLDFARMTHVTT